MVTFMSLGPNLCDVRGYIAIILSYSHRAGMKLYTRHNIIIYFVYAYKLDTNLFGVGRTFCRCRT